MFILVDKNSYLISQPSLYNLNVSHQILINRSNIAMEINFIEIQMPCFDLYWSSYYIPIKKYLLN